MTTTEEEVPHCGFLEAIRSAVVAGACWRAARMDKRSTEIWTNIAQRHHAAAAAALARGLNGAGHEDPAT